MSEPRAVLGWRCMYRWPGHSYWIRSEFGPRFWYWGQREGLKRVGVWCQVVRKEGWVDQWQLTVSLWWWEWRLEWYPWRRKT